MQFLPCACVITIHQNDRLVPIELFTAKKKERRCFGNNNGDNNKEVGMCFPLVDIQDHLRKHLAEQKKRKWFHPQIFIRS